ncbi:unnamed protein product, partial [Mesorhabditis spiculigera]
MITEASVLQAVWLTSHNRMPAAPSKPSSGSSGCHSYTEGRRGDFDSAGDRHRPLGAPRPRQLEAASDVAEGMRTERSAELTVCASMTVAEHLIPAWLGVFRSLHPGVTVHLQVYNSTRVLEAVESLPSVTVARDSLVVVVHPDHPWARRRKPLTVAELAATPLLVREPGSGTRTTLDLALHEYERGAPLLELGSSAAIRTSVLGGVGPAVLSTLAVEDQVKQGELRVVAVEGLELDRSLRAVWRPPRQLEGPAGDLMK